MSLQAACPSGTSTCDDVRADNLLWLALPFAVGLAFVVAQPLSRVLPHRPLVGWPVALAGAVAFVYCYGAASGMAWWLVSVFSSFAVGVIGISLARGTRS